MIPEAGPDFVCAMEEVPDVYQRPYDEKCPAVCPDESPVQSIGEKRHAYTGSHGIEHADYEYIRNGTADIFMVTEPPGGRREVVIRDRHTRPDRAEVTAHVIEDMYPNAEKVTLIQDSLSAHKKSALYELSEPERARNILKKIEFVFTPKHGSWLNIAEIELSVLTRQGLKQRIGNKDELERQTAAWYEERNRKNSNVKWQFTTKEARQKLLRLYPSV